MSETGATPVLRHRSGLGKVRGGIVAPERRKESARNLRPDFKTSPGRAMAGDVLKSGRRFRADSFLLSGATIPPRTFPKPERCRRTGVAPVSDIQSSAFGSELPRSSGFRLR